MDPGLLILTDNKVIIKNREKMMLFRSKFTDLKNNDRPQTTQIKSTHKKHMIACYYGTAN